MEETVETNVPREPAVKYVTWIIKNFKSQDSARSDIFRMEEFESVFYISLYKSKLTKRVYDASDVIVSFKVLLIRNAETILLNAVNIKLSIGTNDNQKVFTELRSSYSFDYSIKESLLLSHLAPDGSLTVNISIGKQSLSDRKNVKFDSFLNNQSLSDVVFKIDEDEIPAHKILLASASSVFKEMFARETESNFTSVVQIKGIDSIIFKEFLSYIYTGCVANLEIIAVDLFDLANKYDIPALRDICEEHLGESLLVDNVISVLHLADRHNSVNLKNKCFEYMDTHFERVRDAESFKNLELEGKLLMEFLCATRMKKPRFSKTE